MSELIGLQSLPQDNTRPHIGFVYTREEDDDFQSVEERIELPNKYSSIIKEARNISDSLQSSALKNKTRPHIGFVYTREEDDGFPRVVEPIEHPNTYPSVKNEAGYTSVQFHEENQPYHGPTHKAHEWQRQNSSSSQAMDHINNQYNAELSSFVQKKSFAQNMMDIALLSANTNQLRYVIDLGEKHPYYMTSLLLIVVSLVMQIVVGLSMLYVNRYNMKNKTEMKAASHMNNLSVAGVFLVTLVNVFISTFNGAATGAAVGVVPSEMATIMNTDNLPQSIPTLAANAT